MMNVSGKSLLLLLVSATLFTGCEDPQVSVSTLGRKLAAPVLSSSNPFDQDMETQGYVRITGTCDTRVGPLMLGFNESSFHSPPSTPNTSGTSLGSITNDSDCSDGKFDIYLTSADLLSIWGVNTNGNGDESDSERILIKGETWFGDTRTLVLTNPRNDSYQGTHVALRKVFPPGFAGASQCEMFNAQVTDTNGNDSTNKNSVSFTIQDSKSSGLLYYQNFNDCSGNTNAVSTFTIPAKQSHLSLVARMPSSPVDVTYGFTPVIVSGGLQAAAATNVILRDPASSRRFIGLTDAPSRLYKNVCHAVTLQRMSYYKSAAYETPNLTVTLNPSDTNLEFFNASDCNSGAKTSVVDFTTSIATRTIYVKYTYLSGTTSANRVKVDINYTVSDSNYDTPPYVLDVDISNNSTVANIDFSGPNSIRRSECTSYKVTLANTTWSEIPADKEYVINFASSNSAANLQFYSDENCTSSVSSMTVSQGEIAKKFFVKSSAAQNANTDISMSTAGLTTATHIVSIGVEALSYAISTATTSYLTKDACNWVTLTYMDSAVIAIPAINPVNLSFYTISSGAAGNVTLYTDSSCTSATPENTLALVNPYNSTEYKFYIKVNSAFADSSLTLILNTSGGLFSAPPFNIYFNLTP